jgi:hypothetical protein
MKKLSPALAALALAAPAALSAQDVAPAVKRAPAAAAPTVKPVGPATGTAPAATAAERTSSPRDYQAALAAAAGKDGSDAALEASLIRVMSGLMASGRCGEAASLASRDGRKELATRAQQLCK